MLEEWFFRGLVPRATADALSRFGRLLSSGIAIIAHVVFNAIGIVLLVV